VGTCSRLATMLDADMLGRHGTPIAPPGTPDVDLQRNYSKTGNRVSWELGGRYLVRYLTVSQVTYFAKGNETKRDELLKKENYVTPTPYSPEEAVAWLALPSPHELRYYALFLKPEIIPEIWGPRWVRMGGGIEYIVPQIPPDAMVDIGTSPGTRWPLLVT